MRDGRDEKRRSYAIRSIEKAVRVLEAFTNERPERSVTEISAQLGWHKAVVHKILITLEHGRLVQREGVPLLKELSRRTSHTATLAILDGLDVLYVAAVEGVEGLKLTARVGDRRQAHATASGKILLADLSPEDLDRLLDAGPLLTMTPQTIVDPARLRAHLDEVRKLGFALNIEERIPGMVGVAAPVRDHHGATIAAVSVGFARHLHGDTAIKEAVGRVVETANDLSRRLGAPADRLTVPLRPLLTR